ncbi:gamma-glutamyl-gamma-aminobutyrate hydrolase family protein [Streptomyces sp. NPDC088350]|uniref:gamma-glutamyl-gamma-aminobutyrate hydrolase family protein n=1 Tax=Streptomyces sp. NPDC088350 TaxID=3365854 RepID=UPI0037F656B0
MIAVPVRLDRGDAAADPRVRAAYKASEVVLELVRTAGARPVLVEPGRPEETEVLLSTCQGFLVPGGSDVDPALYGGPADHPAVYDVNPAQDRLDLAVIEYALRVRRPLLGICRGLQLLNVARGGTLFVDLPPTTVTHSLPFFGGDEIARHDVELEADSRCAAVYDGQRTISVASAHHQAVDEVGTDLRVTARAADGCVEAVEASGTESWLLGVQWHPELENADAALRLPLFTALTKEANRA